MSLGKGFAARAAIGKETTWGSGVAITRMLPFSSESIDRAIAKIMSEYLDGNAARRGFYNGPVSVTGSLGGDVIYDSGATGTMTFEQIIYAAVMAAGTRDATNGLNKYTPGDNDNVQHTIAFDKNVSVWELHGAKANTLEISGEASSKVTFSTDLIAKDLLRTGDTGIVNASSAFDGISYTDPTNLVFNDLTFRIGDQSNALASGDKVKISKFTLSLNNNLTDPSFSTEDASHDDADLTLEPVRNGWREITLKVTLPRYESDQFFTWEKNGTNLQCDLKFVRGSYQFNVLLPFVKISESPKANIGGAEIYGVELTFQAFKNNSNTYMTFTDATAITSELGIEVKSDRTTPAGA